MQPPNFLAWAHFSFEVAKEIKLSKKNMLNLSSVKIRLLHCVIELKLPTSKIWNSKWPENLNLTN